MLGIGVLGEGIKLIFCFGNRIVSLEGGRSESLYLVLERDSDSLGKFFV